jgi:hypothetical protein
MFLGILRTFELHYKEIDTIKQYCEPRGFFGWGYDCDVVGYNIALGNLPYDYQTQDEMIINNFHYDIFLNASS